jgi:hypothetical protein
MELLFSLVAVFGVSGLLIWIGDKTGKDTLNKIGMTILGVGLLVVLIIFGEGGGGLEPVDFYRR